LRRALYKTKCWRTCGKLSLWVLERHTGRANMTLSAVSFDCRRIRHFSIIRAVFSRVVQ
jgi:hypothetical protein